MHQGVLPNTILQQIVEDRAILEVFLFVLNRRMTVMDDLEFRKSFLKMDQIMLIADLLNRGLAYKLFSQQDESLLAYFENTKVLENLKKCIQRLYERDKRLKLFPPNFWIVDKRTAERIDSLNIDSVIKSINQSLLVNAPQTIPFEVRAYFFRQVI